MVSELFRVTFQMSLLVSGVILCIFLLSPFLKRRYGAAWRFSVWGVCVALLVLPFAKIFTYSFGCALNNTMSLSQSAELHTQAENGMLAEILDQRVGSAGYAMVQIFHSIPNWIAILWVVGIGVMCLVYLVRSICFQRNVKQMLLLSTPGGAQTEWIRKNVFPKMKRTLPVYFCPGLETSMITGILKPVILLPDCGYTMKEMQMILLHETAHFQRRDLWWKAFFMAVRSVYWYNPVIALMLRCADQEMELCCDQSVIKGKGKAFRNDYGQLILEEAKRVVRKRKSPRNWVLDFSGDKKQLRIRLEALFAPRKKKGRFLLFSAIVIGILLCGVVFAQDQLYETATLNGYSALGNDHGANPTVENEAPRDVIIATPELDAYLSKIKDPERRELIQAYFSLPVDLVPKSQMDTIGLPLSQQAEQVSRLSTDELRSIVDEMKANIPALKEKKTVEYEQKMKETFGDEWANSQSH